VSTAPQTASMASNSIAKPQTAVSAPRAETKPKKQGHFCVWHGLNFANWVRLLLSRPPISMSSLPRLASISAVSALNSWNELVETCVYGGRVEKQKIEHPPIFILGHWRSGTTLLHNLMTLDSQFTYPNLYHVMYPGSFLLTEKVVTRLTGWVLPKTRPMDNLPTGWNLPQEDEMALLVMTLISPYLMLAHQRDRSKYNRFFDLTELTPEERRRWQDAFVYFLKKLTVRENKPIVLKSPSHTFRVPILLEMFPDAKFVYIYRDPYAVYTSGMHLRRTLFTENGLGKPWFEGMEDDVLQVYSKCFESYETTKHLIPSGRLHEIRFEDLEADPLGQMRRVYERLGLGGWENVEPAIRAELPSLTEYRKNTFNMDEQLMRRVYSQWRDSFERYGYPSRLPDAANNGP
jgi:omega-hydroxy-beta-dihydromenaquinone-9 sulfotransferase